MAVDSTMKSLVGYAVWYLERGTSVPETLERMRANTSFNGVPESDLIQAIRLATASEMLTTHAQTVLGDHELGKGIVWHQSRQRLGKLSLRELLSQSTRLSDSDSSLNTPQPEGDDSSPQSQST